MWKRAEAASALGEAHEAIFDDPNTYWGRSRSDHLRIKCGDLDLILVRSKLEYDIWKNTTKKLIENKPLTRQEAINAFKTDSDPYSLGRLK